MYIGSDSTGQAAAIRDRVKAIVLKYTYMSDILVVEVAQNGLVYAWY
jgi:hypothetical protein